MTTGFDCFYGFIRKDVQKRKAAHAVTKDMSGRYVSFYTEEYSKGNRMIIKLADHVKAPSGALGDTKPLPPLRTSNRSPMYPLLYVVPAVK